MNDCIPVNPASTNLPRYLVISPVKDEECYVEQTLRSMIAQTVRPVAWIIVDDGSSDRTPEIIERYVQGADWIRLVRNPKRAGRAPGSAVIRAFNTGYDAAKGLDYDYVVKLDCDLSFDPDYFERLLSEFTDDPQLGIASGVYLESPNGQEWAEIGMPPYHAAGASKVMRRECFEAIGGFIPSRGWDTVDEIRAMTRGWHTTHFRDLKMKHWKVEGSGIGAFKTNLMHGEIYYLTGGSILFFLLKILHRATRRPLLVGAFALLWGYLKTLIGGAPRLVTADEARCYRAVLNQRIGLRRGTVAGRNAG